MTLKVLYILTLYLSIEKLIIDIRIITRYPILVAPRKYYRITKTGIKKLNQSLDEWKTFLNGVFEIIGGQTHE